MLIATAPPCGTKGYNLEQSRFYLVQAALDSFPELNYPLADAFFAKVFSLSVPTLAKYPFFPRFG